MFSDGSLSGKAPGKSKRDWRVTSFPLQTSSSTPPASANNAPCPDGNSSRSVTMGGPSPHKPRRKVKKTSNGSEVSSVAPSTVSRPSSSRPAYPLAAFLWPARSSVSQWEILPLILMAVGLFRWAAGLWGYSGTFTIKGGFSS
jgi:hypothetical protein